MIIVYVEAPINKPLQEPDGICALTKLVYMKLLRMNDTILVKMFVINNFQYFKIGSSKPLENK